VVSAGDAGDPEPGDPLLGLLEEVLREDVEAVVPLPVRGPPQRHQPVPQPGLVVPRHRPPQQRAHQLHGGGGARGGRIPWGWGGTPTCMLPRRAGVCCFISLGPQCATPGRRLATLLRTLSVTYRSNSGRWPS